VPVTRKRCWQYDWVLEFDIKGLFGNINHALVQRVLEKHTAREWVRLYLGQWLTAPVQQADGTPVRHTSSVRTLAKWDHGRVSLDGSGVSREPPAPFCERPEETSPLAYSPPIPLDPRR
jgi:hypothetical protein